MNLVTIDDPVDSIFHDSDALEPPVATVVTFKHDPIVLACASYRIWKISGRRWASLDQMVPMSEDQVMADQIRNYYRAKITWQTLKSSDTFRKPISEFRRKLMGIIEGTYEITNNDQGILYRLPYFYVEDTAEDSVFEEYTSVEIYRDNQHSGTYKFSLIREIFVSRKQFESVHFWLQSPELPVPCLIVSRTDNSLLPLLRSVVNRAPVELSTRLFPKWRANPGNESYYRLGDVRMA